MGFRKNNRSIGLIAAFEWLEILVHFREVPLGLDVYRGFP